MEDKKRDYLIKTLSRTNRKDYENYVVNRIWNLLNNTNIKPVTQQYVKRDEGFALIDLYFPQVNYAIECDESYHQENTFNDIKRQLNVQERLSALTNMPTIKRIDVTQSLDEINRTIDCIVSEILLKYQEAGSPEWKIEDPVAYTHNKGSLSPEDDIHFSTIYNDIYRLFGKQPAQNSRVRCSFYLNRESADGNPIMVWCPQLTDQNVVNGTIWSNTIAHDLSKIYETCTDKNVLIKSCGDGTSKNARAKRYIFGKCKNCLGEVYYRFLGVYKFDKLEINENGATAIHKRISNTISFN